VSVILDRFTKVFNVKVTFPEVDVRTSPTLPGVAFEILVTPAITPDVMLPVAVPPKAGLLMVGTLYVPLSIVDPVAVIVPENDPPDNVEPESVPFVIVAPVAVFVPEIVFPDNVAPENVPPENVPARVPPCVATSPFTSVRSPAVFHDGAPADRSIGCIVLFRMSEDVTTSLLAPVLDSAEFGTDSLGNVMFPVNVGDASVLFVRVCVSVVVTIPVMPERLQTRMK
jgi:hypothetical protein